MKNSCVNWYKKCINSLFGNETDNWLYRILNEFSTICRLEEREEIIKDTKYRYRALLDTSLDVFTGDRMGNKSYQLPFAMYYVAKCMFRETVAAIVSEAIMSVANWDYRVRSNILRLILFDDNPEDGFIEKMTIFFMALEETKALENTHMSDCSGMSFAEFYPEIVSEIEHLDYYEYCRYEVGSLRPDDLISQDFIDILIQNYGVDTSYIQDSSYLLARTSDNPQLMRILAYAEKLAPGMLDAIEVQLRALVNQGEDNQTTHRKTNSTIQKFTTVSQARDYLGTLHSFAAFNPNEISDEALIKIANTVYESENN